MARLIDLDQLMKYPLRRGSEHCDEKNADPRFLNGVESILEWAQTLPTLTPPPITGDTSDGYHTFNELYHHRAVLFSVVCNEQPDIAWKSKRHHDGTMYDGMFIVGINTPEGQATYHYYIDPYWELFRIKELEYAPEWDGHTPDEAIRRIGTLTPPNEWVSVEERLPENDAPVGRKQITVLVCSKAKKVSVASRIYEPEREYSGKVYPARWRWSKLMNNYVTHWMPLPKSPKEDK